MNLSNKEKELEALCDAALEKFIETDIAERYGLLMENFLSDAWAFRKDMPKIPAWNRGFNEMAEAFYGKEGEQGLEMETWTAIFKRETRPTMKVIRFHLIIDEAGKPYWKPFADEMYLDWV